MTIEQIYPLLVTTKQGQSDPIRRALDAFYMAGDVVPIEVARDPIAGRIATKAGKPSGDGTKPRPMHFVVVHAGAVVLATFKVRQVNDSLMLRRMVRMPKDLVRLKGKP